MKRPKPKTTANGPIPAVGYIRMSTDDQKDSPDRQRGEIQTLADRDGYKIIRWYEDHGLTGTESANRPNFQRLMKDIEQHDFQAVLMYEQSRFSREDIFDAMAHWKLLKDAGITIVTVQRGEMRFDDIAGLLTAMIGQHEARSESVKLSHRVLSGKKKKAAQGDHHSTIPFGYDKEIRDESGTLMKRLSNTDRFKRPKTWKSSLVPSADPAIVDSVRYIFESVASGVPIRTITRELNNKGLRTGRKLLFRPLAVRRIVQNPVYTGLLRFGQTQRGKFEQQPYDLIVVANAHPPLVSVDLFQRANRALDAAYRAPGARGPAGQYPLSKIVVCGHCGRGMTGRTLKGKGKNGADHRQYFCHETVPGENRCPVGPGISADALEGLILRLVGKHILCEANRQRLASAIQTLVRSSKEPSAEMGQLQELRLKIERAEENLALAENDDDYRAIAGMLRKWRESERNLLARVDAQNQRRGPQGIVAMKSADDLKLLRENLHLADRIPLAAALRSLVERVVVSRESIPKQTSTDVSLNQCFGTIEFFPELFVSGEETRQGTEPWVIPFADADLWPERQYLDVADYVSKAGRPVRSRELAEQLKIEHTLALYHAKRAVKVGLIGVQQRGNVYTFCPRPTA